MSNEREGEPKSDPAEGSARRSRARRTDPGSGIYAPPRQSAQPGFDTQSGDRSNRPGIFSRLTGRHRIDEIRQERLRPYQYDSNAQALRWAAVTMALWCCAVAVLAFTDWRNGQLYSEWVEAGIETIPPSSDLEAQIEPARLAAWRDGGQAMECAYLAGRRTSSICPEGELPSDEVEAFIVEQDYLCFQRSQEGDACEAVWSSRGIVEFARIEGFDCPDGKSVFTTLTEAGEFSVGCNRVFDLGDQFAATQDRSQLIWLFVILAGSVVAFPYLSVIHRASRNLLTLNSRGQKHRPEWAVLHHFIPFFNLVMPGLVMREIFRGSDPSVSTGDAEEWKRTGRANPIVFGWYALWVLALVMNPIVVPRIFGATNLPELLRTNNMLLSGDLIMLALGVVGVLMLRQLHGWQERRHALVGLITVTPPQPLDPLQVALGNRDADSGSSDDSDDRK